MSAPPPTSGDIAVDVRDLNVGFRGAHGMNRVVRDVCLQIRAGEIVGLVGESGSGKSVTAHSLMRLLPSRQVLTTAQTLRVLDWDLNTASDADVARLRGAAVSIVFQEPLTALNPILSVGRQMQDVIRRHTSLGRAESRSHALALLADMLIDEPERVFSSFPHQLSGGMRQRVLLGMAFACAPRLLIADEPTTALDVTVQAQILNLIRRKADETRAAVLFVTHDLAVVSQLCDRVYVMYAGSVVEQGPVQIVLESPQHPYTQALLAARPERHPHRAMLGGGIGAEAGGAAPAPGCAYQSRCALSDAACRETPKLGAAQDAGHQLACWRRPAGPT